MLGWAQALCLAGHRIHAWLGTGFIYIWESLGMSKLRKTKVSFRQNVSENILTSLTSILTTVLTSVVKEMSECMSKN